MNNKRSCVGNASGRSIKRVLLNAVLLLAIATTSLGAAVTIKTKVIDRVFPRSTVSASATTAPFDKS
jgi:hypothetical protein